MRFDFELQVVFFDLKNECPCLCSPKYAKSDRNCFFDNPLTQVVGFWSVIRFSNRKMACSSSSKYYPRQQTAAERSMSCKVTAVWRRCFGPHARSARLSMARLQSAGAGLSLETQEQRTRRAPLRGYVLMEYTVVQQQRQQSATM